MHSVVMHSAVMHSAMASKLPRLDMYGMISRVN